jgi:hypothetical protein
MSRSRKLPDIFDVDDLPREMLIMPFTAHNSEEDETGFAAEFVGLRQRPITLGVKPEIGWPVKERRTPPPPKKS